MRVHVPTVILLLSKPIELAAYPSELFVDNLVSTRNAGWSSESAYIPASRNISNDVGSNFSLIGAQVVAADDKSTLLSEETTSVSYTHLTLPTSHLV